MASLAKSILSGLTTDVDGARNIQQVSFRTSPCAEEAVGEECDCLLRFFVRFNVISTDEKRDNVAPLPSRLDGARLSRREGDIDM